nr:hypothetical protein [Lentzea terrae]
MVTKPAGQVGLTVERALVTKILADASGQPGALPISHICTAVARDLTEDEWRHHLPSTPYARTCGQPVG